MGRPKDSWRNEANPRWNGGTCRSNGYVLVRRLGHPNADKRGYVSEHALVMSEKIGRPIAPHETVHHVNGIRDDNRPENLVVMTRSEHHSLHHKGVRKPNSLKNLRPPTHEESIARGAKRKGPPKMCETCGAPFFRRGNPKGAHVYCSRRCYVNNRVWTGASNPAFKHGRYSKAHSPLLPE